MTIITKSENNIYSIKIVSRFYTTSVKAQIRSKISGKVESFDFETTIKNNVMSVDLLGFIPKENTVYELILLNSRQTIWWGQISYLQ